MPAANLLLYFQVSLNYVVRTSSLFPNSIAIVLIILLCKAFIFRHGSAYL